jgi:hypothetical protein
MTDGRSMVKDGEGRILDPPENRVRGCEGKVLWTKDYAGRGSLGQSRNLWGYRRWSGMHLRNQQGVSLQPRLEFSTILTRHCR